MADAPPVVAQSADGVLHQFPAGTDMAVVDGVMKQYAVDNAPPPPPKPPEEPQGLIEPGAIASGLGQGAISGVGQTVTGVGALAKTVARAEPGQTSTDLDMMRSLDDGADFGKLMKAAPNDLARVALREYQLGDADQRAAMKQRAINTMAAPPGQIETTGEHLMKAGEGITGKETFPLTPAEEQRSDVKIAMMVGSMTKYIGAAAAGGMPAMAGMAGVDAYGETYNKAKTAGATDQDATIAGLGGLLTQGGLMTLPIGQFTKAFELVPAPLKSKMIQAVVDATGGKIKGGVASAIATGAEGAATLTAFSQLSTIADNVVAQNTYEPNRPTTQGVGENLGETAIAGAILPLVGAGANRLFRGRDQVPNPKPVLDAPTIDDAIAKADQVASGPVDVGELARGAQEFGNEDEKQQAKVLQLFSGLNEGEVRPTQDGGYAYHVGDEELPLKIWDENAAQKESGAKSGTEIGETGAAEGTESGTTTISPALAAAQREHYGKLGIDVVYLDDPEGKVPFDGAVNPTDPNTIFLSNYPQRNAAMVAAHEVTHILEATTLPDGTRLVDILHGQVARGLTPEGLQHGLKVFGMRRANAPQREAFPEGPEGAAAHGDAYTRHLITEIAADIGGEAPKFQTFLPKIVNEVQARYGDDAAKGVVQKLIAGFQQAYRTLRQFFFKPEEMAEYGQPETQSQHWVTNLGEIHDTLAKMYAERFGTQAEKENAALVAMKDKAAQARLVKAPEAPAGAPEQKLLPAPAQVTPPPITPENVYRPETYAARNTVGKPGPETAPISPQDPAAYEGARQKAATYTRWLRELGIQRTPGTGDTPDMARVRAALAVEHQRMTTAIGAPQRPARPQQAVEGTGGQPQPETATAAPAATPAAIVAPSGPSAVFAEKIRAEKERVWADKAIMGQTKRGVGRNEQFATDLARERVMREEAGPQIEEAVERGIPAEAMEAISRFYRPEEGETVKGAFDKAVDRWMTIEEAKAAHAFGDEDVATYDMLQKEGGTDPVLREAFDRLNEHYEGNAELPGDEDIPLGTGEAPAHEGAGEEAARGEVGRPGGEEAGAEPGRGGEVPPHEGEPLGPQFSPRETPLLNTPEATADELAARQRQRDKEEAEARMRGRKGGKVPQESADETPLFGGPRQSTLFSPKREEAPPSEEYEAARQAHDVAGRDYQKVLTDFRARRIGDAEFIAAKAKYNEATKVFDVAFEKEAARKPEQPEPEAPEEDRQGTLFSPKSDEPFFSSLKRGVEALRIEKAPPGQWEATIRNMPGVKADERAWVGIEDWLRTQTKPVTKADVLGYINEHEVKVGEVQKGGSVPPKAIDALKAWTEKEFGKSDENADVTDADFAAAQRGDADAISKLESLGAPDELMKPIYDSIGQGATKFGSYVLPGGKNYKELLLTLPQKGPTAEEILKRDGYIGADNKSNEPIFIGGHWDEPNVLAHIRMDDRTGPNGEKVLHVAEIQSDWHQKGRKQGYAGNSENYKVGQDRDGSWHAADEGGGGEGGFATRAEAQAWADRENKVDPAAVPDAPFKTSWPELAMKRVMRYAAENGYDRVSWDTGDTNADRYDLSKQVRELTYNGDNRLIATGHERRTLMNEIVKPEDLADHIGKEAAEKLLAQKPRRGPGDIDDNTRHLTGVDLKVGGEGMKAFYDKQLPVIANKIGKRFGAKVEDTAIPANKEGWHITPPTQTTSGKWMVKSSDYNSKGLQFDTEAEARKALDERAGTADAHSIPVTPAMRQGVMQGQPLFSPRLTDESRRTYTPEERKAYEELGRAPVAKTMGERYEAFKNQLGKRMLIATVDKYLATKSIDPMAYLAQRNFNTSSGALEVLLTKGTLRLNGSAFDFLQRNGGVETQVIRPLHGEHGDWAWWVAANRAESLSKEDREHLFTPQQIETLKKTNQGSLDFDYELPNGKTTRSREAAYMDTLRKYDHFNKNVMGIGVKGGLFTQDNVDKLWSNPFYVPMFRVAEKEGAAPFTGGQNTGGFAKQYGFKKLTGGTAKLHNDLWENVIGNWGHLIDAAGKNIGANQVLDAASLPSNGVARKVTQQEYDHQMTKADRDNTTWTMVDGKKQYWHVNDPLLFDAISAIHAADFSDKFSKTVSWFSRTLRMGVTSDPGFMLRVTIKDSEQAVATAPMSYNVLGNIVKGYQMTDLPGALMNVARAAAGMHEQALRESDELISVMAGGGLMRLGAGHAEGFRRTTAESMSGADLTWADGYRYIKRAARQVKEVLAQSEDINRAALYSELIKRGVPHDEATFAARDLEDFTLSGAAPWVRWIAHAVTFLNAGAQGLYKVGRSAADADRNVTAAVGGKVAWAASARVAKVMTATVLATLALDYIYRNDEDYKKRAEYDRNGKWWFKIGQYQFQIPMGFELAGLARIATNGLDMFFDKEMTGRRWANNALSIVGQNMFMNPTPTAIAPLVDVRTNTTGTGQPIEPKGMENLRPEQRYTSQDTLAARGLSAVGNKIARGIGGPTAEFSSPLQLDYLWNGYTGWLGSAVLGSADRVARQFTNEPVRPAQDLWNVATRGVVSKGPTPQSRYIDTMYQQAEAADKAYGTYEDLIKRQQFAKAQDFYKANAELINRRGLVDAVVRAETSLNQQIRLIQNNPNPKVTGEQKRLQIQQLQAIRNRTAESAFGAH